VKNFILVFCFVNLSTIVSAQDTIKKVNNAPEVTIPDSAYFEGPYVHTEVYASFQGGDIFKFTYWVQQNVTIPDGFDKTKLAKNQGRVTVGFAVNSKGFVGDIRILRGVDPVLDQEVIRCLSNSPKWEPAKQGGKNVIQQFVIPVIFNKEIEGGYR